MFRRASKPVFLHPYFGYRSRHRLQMMARALRTPRPTFEVDGWWAAMRMLVRQYASREIAGIKVTLEAVDPDGETHCFETVTDGEGYAAFDVELPGEWHFPEHPEWEIVGLHWEDQAGKHETEGHVLVPGTATELGVISDVDDTIIETGVTGGIGSLLRNWKRLFREMPGQRIAVTGAGSFYGSLGGGSVGDPSVGARMQATRRPFFFVSSSPWNLFYYLVAFKQAKGLPLGPLMLRDWGFNRKTLGKADHGNHKRASIRRILNAFPDMRFAMIGDDTQADLVAFGEIAGEFPGRIAAIFIRMASSQSLSPAEHAAHDAIEAAGIPLWLGPSYDIGQDFLAAIGVTPGGETTKIVEAAEEQAAPDGRG